MLPAPSPSPSQLVICATQRSGSTMICEDVTNSGLLGRPEEWFLAWHQDTRKDWRQELEQVFRQGRTANGIVAVKLMANKLAVVDSCLATFVHTSLTGPYCHVREIFSDACWVWVRRQDTVAQAISHYLAQATGIYHVVKAARGFVPGNSITVERLGARGDLGPGYDFKKILAEWMAIERDNRLWQQFFQEARIAPLQIFYESVDADTLSLIARQMGVAAAMTPGPRNLTKLPSAYNDELKARFVADLEAQRRGGDPTAG